MADKYLYNNAGNITEKAAITTSSGASDAGKILALDGSGRLDLSFMPVGVGAETLSVPTSENLSAGDFVNIWSNAGNANVRKADASALGKEAHGFVLNSFVHPATAIVYFEGTNTSVTGLTPGRQFLSTTAGLASNTAPTAAGHVVQKIGVATSSTALNFEPNEIIVLA